MTNCKKCKHEYHPFGRCYWIIDSRKEGLGWAHESCPCGSDL